MRKILFFLLFLCTNFVTSILIAQEESSLSHYDKEFYLSFKLHTNGYFALGVHKSFIKNPKLTQFYHVEIGAIKHPKESINNNRLVALPHYPANSYIYGKQNNLYLLRGSYGQKRFFSQKNADKGISLGISYKAGVSLGFLKPYYLDLRVGTSGSSTIVQTGYTETYADDFTNVYSIIAASGFRHGWNEISLTYGGHAQAGLLIDWDSSAHLVKALEIGFMLDVFYKKTPIMITEDNQQAFVNVYLSIHLGSRYNSKK